jgi:phage terminase large subunit GpA-like protein
MKIDKKFFFSLLDNAITEPNIQKISDWAEKYRFMSGKVSSKAGNFTWDNAPFWKEPCDCFSPNSPIREIAIMKGTQVYCTTSIYENILGYDIKERATSTLFVTADKQLLKDFKNIKIDQLIDDSGLRQYIKADSNGSGSRKTGDTKTLIEYNNGKQGFIRLAGSHNKNDFQSIAYQQVLIDEIDSFSDSVQGDGDICSLAAARTSTFKDKAKIGYMSRPSLDHKSLIKVKYENGDQRKWFVPCPHCGKHQVLEFFVANGGEYPDDKGNLKNGIVYKPYGIVFDSEQCRNLNFSSVNYKCRYCGDEFNESFQYNMNLKGYWQPTARAKMPNYRSYHFSGLYVKSWRLMVQKFLEAGKDPNKLQVFYNAELGLTFTESATSVDISIVTTKRKNYPPNVLQNGVLFLTAAADVQDNRIEVEIKAWGERFRCWGVDHRIFLGTTSDPTDSCWSKLASIVNEQWELPNKKKLYIERMGVDSGDGEKTEMIYNFCEKNGGDEHIILPVKGFVSGNKTREKFKLAQIKGRGMSLLEIYVDLYKNQLSKWLNQEWRDGEEYPHGYIDFPATYSDEYLRQLTTEKKIKERTLAGFTRIKWEQHGRNEAFDLNVYNLALADLTIWQISVDELQLPDGVDTNAVFEYLKTSQ